MLLWLVNYIISYCVFLIIKVTHVNNKNMEYREFYNINKTSYSSSANILAHCLSAQLKCFLFYLPLFVLSLSLSLSLSLPLSLTYTHIAYCFLKIIIISLAG